MKSKTSVVFGLRGSGKSTLLDHVASRYKQRALVFDTLNEAPPDAVYHSYAPHNRYAIGELENLIRIITPPTMPPPAHWHSNYDFFAIDESNRFCPPKPHVLPPIIADLNDQCRHYGLSVMYLARRPTQLHQDITELAEYVFIFMLKGKNDIKYLNDFAAGLGDAVLKLPPYHFIMVNAAREWKQFLPISPNKSFVSRAKQNPS